MNWVIKNNSVQYIKYAKNLKPLGPYHHLYNIYYTISRYAEEKIKEIEALS